jgi:hypothetical protein
MGKPGCQYRNIYHVSGVDFFVRARASRAIRAAFTSGDSPVASHRRAPPGVSALLPFDGAPVGSFRGNVEGPA